MPDVTLPKDLCITVSNLHKPTPSIFSLTLIVPVIQRMSRKHAVFTMGSEVGGATFHRTLPLVISCWERQDFSRFRVPRLATLPAVEPGVALEVQHSAQLLVT